MSLLYLILGVLALFTAAVSAGDVVNLDSLFTQCQFMVDGNKFNLCPMFERQKSEGWFIQYERRTPPSITTGQYRIMIDGKLPKDSSLEDKMQCPDGTTICLTTYTRYDGEPFENAKILNTIPVAGTLSGEDIQRFVQFGKYNPGLNVQAEMYRRWNATDDSLRVTLHGGYFVEQKQSATIHFICDEDHSNAQLRRLWTYNGNHIFTWTSPHSCIQEGGSPPPNNDTGEEEQELVNPPLISHSTRRLWTVLFLSTCAAGGVAYLIYFPPRFVRRHAQKYLKDHPSLLRFRVGENVLVRWAHEDLNLEEEEGLMIDGDDVNGFSEEQHIPLKPSPRKGGVITYGSA